MVDPGQGNHRVGRGMIWVAAIGLLAGLTFFFQSFTGGSPGRVISLDEGGKLQIVLERDGSGHYLAEGTINGRNVLFLVDTGATDVAISQTQARALGLDFGPRIRVMTAGGPVTAWRSRLDRVSVGNLALDNVRATITSTEMSEVLLGMSFLSRFSIRQQDDELVIESKESSGR